MMKRKNPGRWLRRGALAAAVALALASPGRVLADGLAEESWITGEETAVTAAQAQELPARSPGLHHQNHDPPAGHGGH